MRSRNDLWLLMVFLQSLLVTTLVATAQSAESTGHIYITGQVEKQGAVEIPAGETLTIWKVIILSGGLSAFADKLHVKVLRPNPDGTSQTIMVNMAEITDHNRLQKDIVMRPGDTVVVPMLPVYDDYRDK